MTLPGVATELAVAVRRVNALRARVPAGHRPPFDEVGWRDLQRKLAKARSCDRALELIAGWELDAKLVLSTRLANAPLEDRAA